MEKQSNPAKKTVGLEVPARPARVRHQPAPPSRIRRDPVPENKPLPGFLSKVDWNSREMEMALAIAGIIGFALAIDALSIGISVIYN